MRTSANGQALIGIVIISSLLFTLASAAALSSSLSNRSRVKTYSSDRVRAYYATEGAVVWAMQRLWADPTSCNVGQPPALNGFTATIAIVDAGTACPGGPCTATPSVDHQICATVPAY